MSCYVAFSEPKGPFLYLKFNSGGGRVNNYVSIISGALDGAVKRGELISNNLANIGTPGYKRQDTNFKSILNKKINADQNKTISLNTTTSKHIPFRKEYSNPNITVSNSNKSYRNDQNNVDVDFEMAEMAKNSIYYNVMTRRAAGHFSTLNQVINQGGR